MSALYTAAVGVASTLYGAMVAPHVFRMLLNTRAVSAGPKTAACQRTARSTMRLKRLPSDHVGGYELARMSMHWKHANGQDACWVRPRS